MPQKYTKDFQSEVLSYRAAHTVKETLHVFSISKGTLERWLYPKTADKILQKQKQATKKKYETNPGYRHYVKSRAKDHYQENKQYHLDYRKNRYTSPSYQVIIKKSRKKSYQANSRDPNWRKEQSIRTQKWHKDNTQKSKQQRKIYFKQRFESDLDFRLLKNYRTRLRNAVKKNFKSQSTRELLGCNNKTFKNHLEFQFTEGMSWNNYGDWHVDHIIPCSSFKLSDKEEQKRCFHYTNLQPLWAIDNLTKGDAIFHK